MPRPWRRRARQAKRYANLPAERRIRSNADLDTSDHVGRVHLAEALSYRRIAFGWDALAR